MKLLNLSDSREGNTRTISMDLEWEESGRPAQTLYFSADGTTAELLHASPDAFAVACLPMVAWVGEKRMQVEGTLCTRYRAGLNSLNQVYSGWFKNVSRVALEPTAGFVPTTPPAQRRVASMLSGGVDGLASLRQNRLDYPLDHPESIRACISLFGVNTYDHDENGPVAERLRAFSALQERLQGLAEAEQFELLAIRTNVRTIGVDYSAWASVGFGGGHIAVAQLFQGTFDKILYASDGEGPNPHPGPIHPLVTPWFSSNAVVIQSDQDELLRSDKVALLADWDQGRQLMQPCHYVHIPKNGQINCGQCEKCIRTMLLLLGLGRLDEVSAFDDKNVTPSNIRKIPLQNKRKAELLLQSIPLLQKAERLDLVRAIRRRVLKFHFLGK
jgi:hypothetical protein